MSTVTITIDEQTVEVASGKTVIQAAHEAGIHIPYYCYHPGLIPDGNCRICLVKVEKAPKLMVACKTPVADGMVISTDIDEVHDAQHSVMEFMLLNHPIDCPVCDQAGECKLQDYYFEHNLQNSRFKESKNHKPKAQEFGPHVMFDGERCIMCSRCVRFCRDVTETYELGLLNRGDRTLIALASGKTLDNPYSMNVVDICPVGALTSRDFRFRKRVWFMDEQPGSCPGCATGCAVRYDFDPRENKIYRVRGDKALDVNGYWMCDDGRALHLRGEENRQSEPVGFAADAASEFAARWMAADKKLLLVDPAQSNEVYTAIKALSASADLRGAPGYGLDDGYKVEEDNLLIHADKNPNRAGRDKILGKLDEWDGAASLDGYDLIVLVGRDRGGLPAGSVLVSPWQAVSEDVAVLPATTWWESQGTSLNVDGVERPVNRVLKTPAAARDGSQWLQLLQEGAAV